MCHPVCPACPSDTTGSGASTLECPYLLAGCLELHLSACLIYFSDQESCLDVRSCCNGLSFPGSSCDAWLLGVCVSCDHVHACQLAKQEIGFQQSLFQMGGHPMGTSLKSHTFRSGFTDLLFIYCKSHGCNQAQFKVNVLMYGVSK